MHENSLNVLRRFDRCCDSSTRNELHKNVPADSYVRIHRSDIIVDSSDVARGLHLTVYWLGDVSRSRRKTSKFFECIKVPVSWLVSLAEITSHEIWIQSRIIYIYSIYRDILPKYPELKLPN